MSDDENHGIQESELIRQARQQVGIDSTKRPSHDTEEPGHRRTVPALRRTNSLADGHGARLGAMSVLRERIQLAV